VRIGDICKGMSELLVKEGAHRDYDVRNGASGENGDVDNHEIQKLSESWVRIVERNEYSTGYPPGLTLPKFKAIENLKNAKISDLEMYRRRRQCNYYKTVHVGQTKQKHGVHTGDEWRKQSKYFKEKLKEVDKDVQELEKHLTKITFFQYVQN